MNNPTSLLPILSIIISVMVVVGGYWAFRQGFFKQSSEIQDQTINALNTRVQILEGQIKDDAEKIKRLTEELTQSKRLMSAVRHALARRGLHIEVDEDYVTLVDANGQASTQVPNVARVQQPTPSRLTRPVKLQPIPEDDTAS